MLAVWGPFLQSLEDSRSPCRNQLASRYMLYDRSIPMFAITESHLDAVNAVSVSAYMQLSPTGAATKHRNKRELSTSTKLWARNEAYQ